MNHIQQTIEWLEADLAEYTAAANEQIRLRTNALNVIRELAAKKPPIHENGTADEAEELAEVLKG